MIVKTKKGYSDCNKEPIMLIFENDEERNLVISQLQNMELRPGKKRKYLMYPNDLQEDEMHVFMDIKDYL